MLDIPSAAHPLLLQFASAFSKPTFPRWPALLLSAILTTGRRTISNLLRTLGGLASGHPSTYHRILSHRTWSLWKLARILAGFLLDTWLPSGSVALAVDDTVDEHRGQKIYGKACHRDAVRSTHSFTAYQGPPRDLGGFPGPPATHTVVSDSLCDRIAIRSSAGSPIRRRILRRTKTARRLGDRSY